VAGFANHPSRFADDQDSDFKIVCHGRTYHCHRVVLKRCTYFAALLRSGTKESQDGLLFAEEDPMLMEAILSFLYGASRADTLDLVVSSVSGNTKASAYSSSLAENHAASKDVSAITHLTSYIVSMTERAARVSKDPTLEEALCECRLTRHLIYLFVMFDKYQIAELQSTFATAIIESSQDAWYHPDVLTILQMAYNDLPPGIGNQQADDILEMLICDCSSKADMLQGEPLFIALLDQHGALARRMLIQTLNCPTIPQCESDAMYCCFCRSTQRTECQPDMSARTCEDCGSDVTLSERRSRMWLHLDEGLS
jgi:hypothetical protein